VVGFLGQRRREDTTIACSRLIRPTTAAEIFGLDASARAWRRTPLAYVAGEANLWPSLTGTETSTCSAASRARSTTPTGRAHRPLRPRHGKKVRAYSKATARSSAHRRPHDRPTCSSSTSDRGSIPHGAGLPCLHQRATSVARPSFSRRTLSEVEALCDGRHPAQRRLVEMGPWPRCAPERSHGRGDIRRLGAGPVGRPGVTSVEWRERRALQCTAASSRCSSPAVSGVTSC